MSKMAEFKARSSSASDTDAPSRTPDAKVQALLEKYAADLVKPGRPEGSGKALWVGKGRSYSSIREAVKKSSEGDTIYVEGGVYINEPFIVRHSLAIIGVGDTKPELRWDPTLAPETRGGVPRGKGIIDVGPGTDWFYVENMHISGSQVGAKNGSAMRLNNQTTIVVDSLFTGNQIGILGGSREGSDLFIYDTIFDGNGVVHSPPGHGVYFNNEGLQDAGRLVVVNSEFTGTILGHDVKSVVDETVIIGNRFSDENQKSIFALDINGGELLAYNNEFIDRFGGGAAKYQDFRNTGYKTNVLLDSNSYTTSQTYPYVTNESGQILRVTNTKVTTTSPDAIVAPVAGYHRFIYGLGEVENWSVNGGAPIDIPVNAVTFTTRGGKTEKVTLQEGGDTDDIFINNMQGNDYTAVFAGGGNDTIYAYSAWNTQTLRSGDGNDVVVVDGKRNLISADAGDDMLINISSRDGWSIMLGYEGDDVLFNSASQDVMNGGDGDDILFLTNTAFINDKALGGGGYDIAVFDYVSSEVSITIFPKKIFLDMPTGRRIASTQVEVFQFADGVYYTGTETFEAGVYPVDVEAYKAIYETRVKAYEAEMAALKSGTDGPADETLAAHPTGGGVSLAETETFAVIEQPAAPTVDFF
ncbi:MAG: calcium-binding protein [Pseudomonadota bacterium]